jgi:predicted alpha/beta-fold hydrolase
VGFSLGASIALLAFSHQGAQLTRGARALVAVSAPLDLARSAEALERPANRLYQRYFMVMLRQAYRRLQIRRPDLYAGGRERGTRTVREYDEAITACYGGYTSAADYYARSSAGPRLAAVARPTLLLSAWDDPMVPGDSVAAWPLPASGTVTREVLPTGGHVGFVAPTTAPGQFWAAERAMEFLRVHVEVDGTGERS